MKKNLFIFLLTYFSIHSQSAENIDYYYQNPVGPTSSNYGVTGVMEIPNARFMKQASISWNFSASFPTRIATDQIRNLTVLVRFEPFEDRLEVCQKL